MQQDARIGLLPFYSYDMHARAPGALHPPPDPRLHPEWSLRGYLIGTDSVGPDSRTVFYGFLAERTEVPGHFAAVTRGTYGILEWLKDAQFSQTPHPIAGKVEDGFWSIYRSMEYVPEDGAFQSFPAAAGIATAVGNGEITVVGHSLGGAHATYLALDLAHSSMANRVSLRTFASPRPGNSEFVSEVAVQVPDHMAYVYPEDLVPRVPFGFDYAHLPKLQELSPLIAQSCIASGVGCGHHILSYLSMMDYGLMDWATVPAWDKDLVRCIKGPAR